MGGNPGRGGCHRLGTVALALCSVGTTAADCPDPPPIKTPNPSYPLIASERRMNGACAVAIEVDTSGVPHNVEVIRCTDRVFVDTSLDAAKKYRFKPGTTMDGKPVIVKMTIQVIYRTEGGSGYGVQISYDIHTPPGTTSTAPDANGVYPLTHEVDAPRSVKFEDEGFGETAYRLPGKGACDVVLIIDAKGNPSELNPTLCEWPELAKLAVRSLSDSHFSPGKLNGKPVAVRASIHLEFGGFSKD